MADPQTHFERVRKAYNLGQATHQELHEAAAATGQNIVSISSDPAASTGAPQGYQAPTHRSRFERFRAAFLRHGDNKADQETTSDTGAPTPVITGNLRQEMAAFNERIASRRASVPQQRQPGARERGSYFDGTL